MLDSAEQRCKLVWEIGPALDIRVNSTSYRSALTRDGHEPISTR